MYAREDSLRDQIALGWIAILVIGSMVFNFTIIQSVLTEADKGFKTLRSDPGLRGVNTLGFVIAFYALMPVYVGIVTWVGPRFLRWPAVAAAALGWMFNLLHHFAHWHAGQKPTVGSHALDFAIHVIGLWVLVNSVRWARSPAVTLSARREAA